MKILFHHWPSFFQQDIQNILQEDGISFDILSWDFRKQKDESAFLFYIRTHYDLKQYGALLSINYWPLLSQICQESNIPYISWCYDAPLDTENIEATLGNETNHIYCFDRVQVADYQKRGFLTVNHLPLGINVKRLASIKNTDSKCNSYQADVSFVGKLYPSVADWLILHSNEYCKGYLQSLINTQREIYGMNVIREALTDSFMRQMNNSFGWPKESTPRVLDPDQIAFALFCEATRRDRIILLSLCGARFHTRLYTYDSSFSVKNVETCPPVNYFNEMPYVFAATKINLNITLRSIQTGIPLRALDIMGCGGFLVSNYQEELADHFCNGEDMVLYESMADALDKIRYYLAHDDLRKRIIENGRKKTFEQFDMRQRLTFLLRNIT